jgi:hypothetical protein
MTMTTRTTKQRGGCWINPAQNLRAANRNSNHATNRNDNLGFRVAVARANTGAAHDDDNAGHGAGAGRAPSWRRSSSCLPLLVGNCRASGQAHLPRVDGR